MTGELIGESVTATVLREGNRIEVLLVPVELEV